MNPRTDTPSEKKRDFNWERCAILLPALFPLCFYLVYLRRNPSPWKALEEPILISCVLALLGCFCGLVLRNRYSDHDVPDDNVQLKTDWRERVSEVAYATLVFAGFFFCAYDKGFISRASALRRMLDLLFPIVVAEFLKGMHHNDRASEDLPESGLPKLLPSLPYLLFPSGRTKH